MLFKTAPSSPVLQSSPVGERNLGIKFILFFAAILYFYKLNAKSLWIDELISIDDAQKFGLDYNFNRGRILYYMLLKLWMRVSEYDGWLRSLAVIFALISVYLIYRLGRDLFNHKIGLVAALLLTVSPVFINHAQEVRYYTLNTMLGLAGSLCLTYFLLNNFKKKWIWGWMIFRFLVIITTPINGALV